MKLLKNMRLWALACLVALLVPPAFAQTVYSGGAPAQNPQAYWLMQNIAVSGPVVRPVGGSYLVHISGTFSGTTLALVESYGGNTQTLGSYTAAPSADPCFAIPEGSTLQMTVSGGSPSAIYASLGSVGPGGCAGTGSAVNFSGGYEFNASVLPTTTNASHAAGVALADLQTISIGSTNSLSGILTQVQYASKGGSTSGVVVYIWSKNPAATTCTNGSALVSSQVDNEFLVVPPILLTPALVLSATDTTTYATASNLVGNFVNGSSNTNLYECTVSNATQTPATTSDIRLNIQGIKDQP